MSKITNCILMLELLQNGRVYSVKELSRELGITDRMVRYYKEQLELSGFVIESFKGPGGGYFINKNDNVSLNYFNKSDLDILDIISSKVLQTEDLDDLTKSRFNLLNNKLHSTYNTNKVLSEYKELDVNVKNQNEKVKDIEKCIKTQKHLLISHLGANGILTKREIIPISFFEFEKLIYVTAFCKLRGDIRQFPIRSILSYEVVE